MDPLWMEFQHLVVEGRRDAVFLFQVHDSLLFVNTFVADFVICNEATATDVPVSIRYLDL